MGNYYYRKNNLYKNKIDLFQINLENYNELKKINIDNVLEEKIKNYDQYINENIIYEKNVTTSDQIKLILRRDFFDL